MRTRSASEQAVVEPAAEAAEEDEMVVAAALAAQGAGRRVAGNGTSMVRGGEHECAARVANSCLAHAWCGRLAASLF